jgi:hypothetical protein
VAFQFTKATKQQRKARIALIGPSGSGKTYSALAIAQGMGSNIAVIDTENHSSTLYADTFDFSVLSLDTFSPETYVAAIRAAEKAGFDVLIIDSLSHGWIGKDGALAQVDKAAARSRSGNTFAAWREVTPKHNELVDTMIRCNCHLIVTMRAKTEYVIEQVERGGKTVSTPRKIGLAPVQRDGMEYEFDLVADMDLDNNLIVSKTRFPFLAAEVVNKPGAELGKRIVGWLMAGEEPPAETPPMEFAKPEPAPQAPPATSLQAQYTEAASKLGVPGDIAEAWAQAMLGGDEDKLQRTVAQLGDARRAASYLNSVTDWRREQLVAEAAKQCGGEEQAGDWMRAVLNGDPAVASLAELELFAKELAAGDNSEADDDIPF